VPQLSFEEIYREYAPQVFRVCMGYLNDPAGARDITQDTFLSVWQHLSSFRHESKISTWIFRIATNNCLRAIDKSKRTATVDLPLELPFKEEERIDGKLAFLYKCIGELEETERIIISLLLEGLPQAEIASVVGLTEVNTRVKIHRVKEKLAVKFKAHGQF